MSDGVALPGGLDQLDDGEPVADRLPVLVLENRPHLPGRAS